MEESRQTTVLFADVSGSTKLYETAGDAVALTAIGRCIERMRKAAESTGGRVVKTIGDEIMALFPSPDAAAGAASEMHATIEQLPEVGGAKLGVRVGFHSGPVIQREDDVFGDTVNMAAPGDQRGGQSQPWSDGGGVLAQRRAQLLDGAVEVAHVVEREPQRGPGVDPFWGRPQRRAQRCRRARHIAGGQQRLTALEGGLRLARRLRRSDRNRRGRRCGRKDYGPGRGDRGATRVEQDDEQNDRYQAVIDDSRSEP